MSDAQLDAIRNTKPADRDHLDKWVQAYTGVRISRQAVCVGHQAPFDSFSSFCLDRPPMMLDLGSRGSGKSFGTALGIHFHSRFNRRHKTRILGGSKDQSRQIYEALDGHVRDGRGFLGSDGGPDTIASLLVERARYRNGSEVSILAASSTSVRGPHVPTLALDEVDEIEPDIRESAMGMNMGLGGSSACCRMTSTWHRPTGPMADLIEQSKDPDKGFPLYTYCTFEVLERCPESRSGPNLEKCGQCPLIMWCHEDRLSGRKMPDGSLLPPKAKISNGHYRIDDLIQKVRTTSKRVFEADYLCKGPKADGIWFPQFDPVRHVTPDAEYKPNLPVHLAIDIGNRTGAVWFQLQEMGGDATLCTVFADFYSDNAPNVEGVAREILRIGQTYCQGRRDKVTHDPAGNSKTAIGPSVITEYEKVGWKGMRPWPIRSIVDSLALLESFVEDATGTVWLKIHPRCKHLIDAMQSFRRGGKAPQWSELPLDPQHPAEDMVDALRGGLTAAFPDGRKRKYAGPSRKASGLIY